jgi:hypothetical protein
MVSVGAMESVLLLFSILSEVPVSVAGPLQAQNKRQVRKINNKLFINIVLKVKI